jgi:hypothetical protein
MPDDGDEGEVVDGGGRRVVRSPAHGIASRPSMCPVASMRHQLQQLERARPHRGDSRYYPEANCTSLMDSPMRPLCLRASSSLMSVDRLRIRPRMNLTSSIRVRRLRIPHLNPHVEPHRLQEQKTLPRSHRQHECENCRARRTQSRRTRKRVSGKGNHSGGQEAL